MHERIERELNELEFIEQTGVTFLRAQQGMRIGSFPPLPLSSLLIQ